MIHRWSLLIRDGACGFGLVSRVPGSLGATAAALRFAR
jgi:hypothetical protein